MHEMNMPCTCCGTLLTFQEQSVQECPACGTHNARPVSTDAPLEMLQRAVKQRLARDFHEAEVSYQQVLLHNPEEHEALWGRLLCRYGVEYVEDPATHRLLPTVHSVQRKPLRSQADFRDACVNAPTEIARQYQHDAAYIDAAQQEIRRLAETCQPYDVFICHKTTKPGTSEKTEDFHRAYQLYYFLKEQGIRAFFAPECMTDVAGANYEAGIYNALTTAKVMLVVCSDPTYLTSPWVRSEWTRFLDMADEDGGKRLVPLLYDGFNPSSVPQFLFRSLQGLNMNQLTASQKLLEIVRRNLPAPAESAPASVPVVPAAPAVPAPEDVPAVPAAPAAPVPEAVPAASVAPSVSEASAFSGNPVDGAQLLYTAPRGSLLRRSVSLTVKGRRTQRLKSGVEHSLPMQGSAFATIMRRNRTILCIFLALLLGCGYMTWINIQSVQNARQTIAEYQNQESADASAIMFIPDNEIIRYLQMNLARAERQQKLAIIHGAVTLISGVIVLLEAFRPAGKLQLQPGLQYDLHWKKSGLLGRKLVCECTGEAKPLPQPSIPADQVIIDLPPINPDWAKAPRVSLTGVGMGKQPLNWEEARHFDIRKSGVCKLRVRSPRANITTTSTGGILLRTLIILGAFVPPFLSAIFGSLPLDLNDWLGINYSSTLILAFFFAAFLVVAIIHLLCYSTRRFRVTPGKRYAFFWEQQSNGAYILTQEELEG